MNPRAQNLNFIKEFKEFRENTNNFGKLMRKNSRSINMLMKMKTVQDLKTEFKEEISMEELKLK